MPGETPRSKLLRTAAALVRKCLPEAPIRAGDRDRFEDWLRRMGCDVRKGMDGMAAEAATLRDEAVKAEQQRITKILQKHLDRVNSYAKPTPNSVVYDHGRVDILTLVLAEVTQSPLDELARLSEESEGGYA